VGMVTKIQQILMLYRAGKWRYSVNKTKKKKKLGSARRDVGCLNFKRTDLRGQTKVVEILFGPTGTVYEHWAGGI